MTAKRLMKALGVDIAAKQCYNQELYNEHTRVFGDVTITQSWVSNKTIFGLALLPLSEIAFFKRDCRYSHQRTHLVVTLLFKGGKRYDLPCFYNEYQSKMMALLTERCPQANQRDYGTYV